VRFSPSAGEIERNLALLKLASLSSSPESSGTASGSRDANLSCATDEPVAKVVQTGEPLTCLGSSDH
jgi:hypothetical protein